MKSRIFLTLAAGLSIGLAQAAAHDAAAAQRSRENKEFALGVAIGMFGPAAAKATGIPFGDTITEGAIRGSFMHDQVTQPGSIENLLNASLLGMSTSMACIYPNGHIIPFRDCLCPLLIDSAFMFGSMELSKKLTANELNPITQSMRKGIVCGYHVRTMKNMLGTEQLDSVDTSLVSIGVLGSLACACKIVYDFWHR